MSSLSPEIPSPGVLAAEPRKTGSMKRDRRRALYWSYFFLVLFVVFFLTRRST